MDIGDWSYGDLLDTAAGQRRRIAELEAALSQSMGDHVDTGRALRLARAENQRLHAAARATVLEWRKDIWPGDEHKCFMNNRMEELAALVGEKV